MHAVISLLCVSVYLHSLGGDCRAGLDLPHAIPDCVQIETLCQLRRRHGCHQVLLVGKD